jgi:hypothetical protein
LQPGDARGVALSTQALERLRELHGFSGADIDRTACCLFSLEYFDISRRRTAPRFN